MATLYKMNLYRIYKRTEGKGRAGKKYAHGIIAGVIEKKNIFLSSSEKKKKNNETLISASENIIRFNLIYLLYVCIVYSNNEIACPSCFFLRERGRGENSH